MQRDGSDKRWHQSLTLYKALRAPVDAGEIVAELDAAFSPDGGPVDVPARETGGASDSLCDNFMKR